MNDIAKRAISEKFREAIEKEGISKSEAARLLNLKSVNYGSQILNEKQWGKCPISAFELVKAWTNSGETLRKYAEKQSHKTKPAISSTKAEDSIKEETVKTIEKIEPTGIIVTDDSVGAFSVLRDVIRQLNEVGYELIFEIRPINKTRD